MPMSMLMPVLVALAAAAVAVDDIEPIDMSMPAKLARVKTTCDIVNEAQFMKWRRGVSRV